LAEGQTVGQTVIPTYFSKKEFCGGIVNQIGKQ